MELQELNLSEDQLASVQKLIQSETDRVRTDYSKKLKDAEQELSQFKPVEKSDKEKELEQKEQELLAKEKLIEEKAKTSQIATMLSEKGLPSELSTYLQFGEDVTETIDGVSKVLNALILGNSNQPSTHSKTQAITKEQFKGMNYLERTNLLNTNPELYKKLNK